MLDWYSMNLRLFLSVFIIFATGVAAGFFAYSFVQEKPPLVTEGTSKQVRQMGSYKYINPLLECDVAEGSIDAHKENFRPEMEDFINTLKEKRSLTGVAVYFRDLNNGPTFGINQEQGFFPASLLKVPLMIAYFHWAERDPSVLKRSVSFDAPKDFGITPTIVSRESLQVGAEYTIGELIERMIRFSDNQALYLLSIRLPEQELQSLFSISGASDKILNDPGAKLTVKEYAGFFRVLFNSSYLTREYSEKALSLLASVEYSDALRAGVPREVVVAHKFGEAGTENVERQLHDCGIVYFPDHPYLACVMTRGEDVETLKTSIADISRFIYEKINEQY